MSRPKERPVGSDRQFLTDADGKTTHVVIPVEAYERILSLIEDVEDVRVIDRRMKAPEFVTLEEAKASLGLQDSD